MVPDTCWTPLKPASRANASISVGVKKLMKGVPLARAPFSAASRRGRRDLAQRGRDRILREIHADAGGGHDCGLVCIEAGGHQPLPPGVARLEVNRHEPQPIRNAKAELDQPLPLPGLRTGPVGLEYKQAGDDLWPGLGRAVGCDHLNGLSKWQHQLS